MEPAELLLKAVDLIAVWIKSVFSGDSLKSHILDWVASGLPAALLKSDCIGVHRIYTETPKFDYHVCPVALVGLL